MSRLPSAANRVRHVAYRPPIYNLSVLGHHRPRSSPLTLHQDRQPQRISAASVFTAAQLEKSLADERLIVPPRLREKEAGHTLSDPTAREVKAEKEDKKVGLRSASQPLLPAVRVGRKGNGKKPRRIKTWTPRAAGSKSTAILRIRKHAVAGPVIESTQQTENGSVRRSVRLLKHVVAGAGIKLMRRRKDDSRRRRGLRIRKQVVVGAGIKTIRRRKGGSRRGRGSRTRKRVVTRAEASRSAEQLNLRRARNLAFSAESKRETLELKQYETQRLEYLRGKAEMPEQNKDADGQIAESDVFAALQGIGSSFDSDGSGSSSEHANEFDSKASAESSNLDWGDLPLSPLMHPQLIKARTKFRQKKPLPSKDLSEFETKIAKSPYAKLLATPIRACRMTGACLPSAFMVRFTILKHPETGKLWQVPISYHPSRVELSFLDKPEGRGSRINSLQESPQSNDHGSSPVEVGFASENGQNGLETLQGEENSTLTPGQAQAEVRLTRVPNQSSSNYMIATRSVIDRVMKLKSSQRNNIYPQRWKERFGQQLLKNGHWREDMGPFIQKLMQEKVIRLLAYTAHINESYFSQYDPGKATGWSPFKPGAAVLWLRASQQTGTQADFAKFVAFMVEKYNCTVQDLSWSSDAVLLHDPQRHIVPVFNIRGLLGDAAMKRLDARHSIFGCHALYVLPKQSTSDLVAWIWRLAGYGKEVEDRPQKSKASSRRYPHQESSREPRRRQILGGRFAKHEKPGDGTDAEAVSEEALRKRLSIKRTS